MKTAKAFLVAAFLLLTPALSLAAGLGHLRISYLKGDVQVKTPEAGEWGLAVVNAPLAEGDQVWVPAGGRVELQLNGGSFLRLDRDSSLQILSLDEDSSQFYLAQGRVYVNFNPPGGNVLQVDTPDASTRAFDNTVYRIDMGSEFSDVSVYKGYVEAENRVGMRRISAGEMLSLSENSDAVIGPMGPPDEWEAWNKTRNRRYLASSRSVTYLPEELRWYAPDFDGNGRWVYVQDYGNVWTPTVIAADWSPYREGRWVWRGGHYVWIGYEPWGWAPYHYGRWAYVGRVGWCWVPPPRRAVYWGPGYVGWVTTSDHVAWVPLAPGEVYYGRGYYGPNSVNITNVNVTEVRITNVYRNVHVHNCVTAVRRDTFATASPTRVRADQNFVRNRILASGRARPGAPDIRPSRGGELLSARPVPQGKLPPQRVRTMEVRELRRERPLVREPQRSVLTPGGSVQTLPVRNVETRRKPGSGRPEFKYVAPASAAPAPRTGVRAPEGTRSDTAGAPATVPPQRDTTEHRRRNPAEAGRRAGVPERKDAPQGAPPAATVAPSAAPSAPSATPVAPSSTPAARSSAPAAPAPHESAPHRRVRPGRAGGASSELGVAPSAAPPAAQPARRAAPATPATSATPASPAAPATPATPASPARREHERRAPMERATPTTPVSPAPAVRPPSQHPSRPAVEVPAAPPAQRTVPAPSAAPVQRSGQPPRESYRTRTPAAGPREVPAPPATPAAGAAPGAAPTPVPVQPAAPRPGMPEGRGGDR